MLFVCIGLGLAASAQAQLAQVDVDALRLERTEEGVFLSATVRFELPAIVEDALLKGIPMYFVAEAELYRDRWYWYDKKVAVTERHLRLAYQPLTRRWRLNVSPRPIGNAGLGVTLTQNFESLPDALASLQRISRWKIAEAADVEPDSRHNVDFRFRLDVSQLPRPFQIGAVGQNSWNISVTRNQRMVVESAR
ncbi:MAG: DUF4390 domain-containing protein [Burkholderiaceae bacterium]|nr:DUF4390 domain-containing protein [Burkholderiaceae bacterium]